ncbi:InlB B-repeat-containing protein [Pseudothauera hydrothermalis]|uniref:InlB B-repeat-containing protein n=1 Tax=Pseudothauera hydrothermalis TaxID=2184083 RepID=UPI0013C2A34F|nr:InlB B-repeat-containing protein [Pseudothauera hydrothermalis]
MLAVAAALAGPAQAADVILHVDTASPVTYTLQSLVVDPSGNVTIYARSGALPSDTHFLTLTYNTSRGTVTVNGAPGQSQQAFPAGTELTLVATPLNANFVFDGWSGGGCSGTGACTVTMNGPVSVSAVFSAVAGAVQRTLGVSAGANGTVSVGAQTVAAGASQNLTFDHGSAVVLTANPASGYQFSSWSGACAGQGATCNLTLTADVTTAASFSPATASACGPTPSNVNIINTQVVGTNFTRTTISPATPQEIQAFRFTTSAGPGGGVADLARLTGSVGQRTVVISQCPGDISTTGKSGGCYASAYDTVSRSFVVGYPNLSPSRYCHLEPNTTYYVNVTNQVLNGSSPTCTTSSNCRYNFILSGN